MVSKKFIVGIFSRESENSYIWLTNFLVTIGKVRDVRPVYITNTFEEFREETLKCNFAIIYHSKNRGRINVTDVTDSLYDKELKYLSNQYGKKNVLVVIDDLEDSSDRERVEILNNQPSIRALAQDLFIFSSSEKYLLNSGTGHQTDRYQSQTDNTKKMDLMKKTIEGKNVPHQEYHGGDAWINQDATRPVASLQSPRRWYKNPIFMAVLVFSLVLMIVLILVITLTHKNATLTITTTTTTTTTNTTPNSTTPDPLTVVKESITLLTTVNNTGRTETRTHLDSASPTGITKEILTT